MSESTSFDLNAFIKESKETLLNPKAYFSTMRTAGGMAEPVIKALIYGIVAGIIVFLWGLLGLGGQAGVFGAGIGAMGLVYTVVSAVIGLFIGAVIVLIISAICKGNTNPRSSELFRNERSAPIAYSCEDNFNGIINRKKTNTAYLMDVFIIQEFDQCYWLLVAGCWLL